MFTHTIVLLVIVLLFQFDLVCDDASKVSLVQTIYMCGFLTGCIGFGQISDRIGRHKALIIALIMEVIFATVVTFVNNYIAYVSLRFIVGASAAGGFTTIFVMCKFFYVTLFYACPIILKNKY